MLTEFKNKYYHYTHDDCHYYQGEYKEFHFNGKLEIHCFYTDDKRHGEYKEYHASGKIYIHCFYVNDKRHREYKEWRNDNRLVSQHFHVHDKRVLFNEIPHPGEIPEDRMYFALKHGLQLLPVETIC